MSRGLLEEFGAQRVVDTPIAELGFAGVGVGAAMAGLRPVIEFMTWNFALLALDQIVNSAAKMRYMSGGQIAVPLVFRGPDGAALQLGAQHSQALESWLRPHPRPQGRDAGDARRRQGTPQARHPRRQPGDRSSKARCSTTSRARSPTGSMLIPLGQADVKRAGTDVTIVCHSKTVPVALKAAEQLAGGTCRPRCVDLRTLRPLDEATIIASVAKTNRCVVVEEGWMQCGVGAQVVDIIQRDAFDELDAPVLRVTQVPTSRCRTTRTSSARRKSTPEKVVAAARRVLYMD